VSREEKNISSKTHQSYTNLYFYGVLYDVSRISHNAKSHKINIGFNIYHGTNIWAEDEDAQILVWYKACGTKEKILTCMVGLSASALTATFLMIGIAIGNPEVDKQFVKDVIPLILTPQITLLSGSFGAYILHTRSKNKK
jgi:hypothetical protein